MTSTNVDYNFQMTISQGLGTSPAVKINTFPSTVTVPSSPTCSITLVSGTVLSQSCIFDNVTRILTLNFTSSTVVSATTIIQITVSGITNPSAPTTNSLGIETYYDSSVSTSRVEYGTSAFTITYTGITNFPATFSPNTMTVYTITSTTVNFTTTINLPSGSQIYI